MAADHPIFAEIAALLDDADGTPLAELEHTLTAGYAAALALESERLRIERKISESAAHLGNGVAGRHAEEIAKLARRLNVADAELSRLRGLLGELRTHAAAARAA